MNELKYKYDINNYMHEYVDNWCKGPGINILEKYKNTTNTRPRNIYKADIDVLQRYENESLILYICFSGLLSLGFNIQEIIEEIDQIDEYYPWLKDIKLINDIKGIDSVEGYDDFIDNVNGLLEEFFKTIEQRTYGEFYSPIEVISAAFSQIDIDKNKKVVDPSCGCGYFLYKYIKELYQLGQLESLNDIEILQDKIYGYDIFPFAIIMSKLILGYTCSKILNLKTGMFKFKNIKVNNTIKSLSCKQSLLNINENMEFDLIIGNPPYFRIDPHDENEICSCVRYGHNYIHSLFVHWSIQHIADNGDICMVLPQSMLSGLYYKTVRKEILDNCKIKMIIANVEEYFNVQQEIMILIVSKEKNKIQSYTVAELNSELKIKNQIEVPIELVQNKNNLIPVFKSDSEIENLNKIAKMDIIDRLKELKLATGNFVWNQNKESCLKENIEGAIRLINGPNLTEEGINNNSNNTTFPYCLPNKEKYIKTEKAILFRRMSPIGNEQRMVAAIINDLNERVPYVVENHVNIITCEDTSILKQIKEFLTSQTFNILINVFCQTNQVSTNELKIIFDILIKIRNNNN